MEKRAREETTRIKLTRPYIERLPAPGATEHVRDAGLEGLALRCHPSGRKTWVLRLRVKGRPTTLTLGQYPDLPPEAARKVGQERRGEIAKGEDPAAHRRTERERRSRAPTFAALAELYATEHSDVHKRDKGKRDRWIISRYLGPIASRSPETISREDVNGLHRRIGRTNGPVIANRAIDLVAMIFGWAVEERILGSSPAAGIRRFKEKPRTRFLSETEIARLWKACEEDPDIFASAFVKLLLLTGARKGELLRMRRSQIDVDAGRWQVDETKTGEPRTVWLSPPAVAVIRALPAFDDWAFPAMRQGKRTDLGDRSLGHRQPPELAWQRIRERAKLEDVTLHDLRRTAASTLLRLGFGLSEIAKALGHRNAAETAQTYAHLSDARVRAAVDRLGGEVARAIVH